jgi:phage shock protein E
MNRSTPPDATGPGAPPPLDMIETEFAALPPHECPVIDVRRPEEFAEGHLEGALLVEVTARDFEARIRELDLDPEGPVYLYCRTGNRSGIAARVLRGMGFGKAVNVGGFEELVAAGLPPAAASPE